MSECDYTINKKSSILYFIPARGNSKGLANKNSRVIDGKPMIIYAIDAAKHCKYGGRVVVSTDNTNIKEIAQKCGAEVPFLRPSNLALDDTPILPVILHCLNWLHDNENYRPDIIVQLQANSPLVTSSCIEKVIETLSSGKSDVVFTVTEITHPAHWLLKLKEEIPYYVFEENKITDFERRQNIKQKIYRSTGTVSAYLTDFFLDNYTDKPRICLPKNTQKSRVVVIDDITGIDIDNYNDFLIAEMFLKLRRDNNA